LAQIVEKEFIEGRIAKLFVKTATRSWPKKALPSLEGIGAASARFPLPAIGVLCNNALLLIPA